MGTDQRSVPSLLPSFLLTWGLQKHQDFSLWGPHCVFSLHQSRANPPTPLGPSGLLPAAFLFLPSFFLVIALLRASLPPPVLPRLGEALSVCPGLCLGKLQKL